MSPTTTADDELVERTVTVDVYSWQGDLIPGTYRREVFMARRGQTVRLTPDEAARGDSLGALGTIAQAMTAEQASGVLHVTDEQLRSMNVNPLLAHVGQNPTEAERVRTIEADGRNRKTVLQGLDRIIAERDAAIEEAAHLEQQAREADGQTSLAPDGSPPPPTIPT